MLFSAQLGAEKRKKVAMIICTVYDYLQFLKTVNKTFAVTMIITITETANY